MRELVADHPAGLPDDPTSPLPDRAGPPDDQGDEAYDDMLVLPFGEASGWRGAS